MCTCVWGGHTGDTRRYAGPSTGPAAYPPPSMADARQLPRHPAHSTERAQVIEPERGWEERCWGNTLWRVLLRILTRLEVF